MNEDLDNFEPVAKIIVIGVGGAGNNAVNRMIDENISNVGFYVANTDKQTLSLSKASNRLILGESITNGLGAGGEPSVGKEAAEASEAEIREIVNGANLVFIAAGMGVVNVTPNDLEIMFNVRNNPLTTQDTLKKYLDSIFGDLPYHLELKQSSYPFITHSRVLVESLRYAIKDIAKVDCSLDTGGGTSDARYFSAFGVDVVEFGLLNSSIHAINENAKVDEILQLMDIFEVFIKQLESNIE